MPHVLNHFLQVSGGLHGVGISVVNALSEQLEVTVWRKGVRTSQTFRQGAPVTPLQQQPALPEDAGKRGTELRFLFDKSIFSEKCGALHYPRLHATYFAALRLCICII